MTESQRPLLPRFLKIGLGCLTVAIVLIGAAVVLNWDRLRSAYRSSAATLSELQSVRLAIQKEYDTPDVGVVTRHLVSRPEGSDLPERILRVELMNPPFLERLADEDLKEKAREIAIRARTAHPDPGKFDGYEIILTKRTGLIVTVGSRRHFFFRSEDIREPS